MENARLLHVGFDGLDVAYQGRLSPDVRAALAEGRERAETTMADAPVDLPGGLTVMVAATGARGGYRYRFDTGEDGETWFAKDNDRLDGWNLRASVKSLALALHGYRGVRKRLEDRLRDMGATVGRESVGRVDICIDFEAPGLSIDPASFVAHSNTSRASHHDGEEGITVHHTGRRVSGVTLGKQPGRQVVVYDKRREAIQKHKFHWFDIWGYSDWREVKAPIWRVEIRAGKQYLKETWHITTWKELDASLIDVAHAIFRQIRYTDPADTDPNVTRRGEHEFWTAARRGIDAYLSGQDMEPSGIVPGRYVIGRRSVLRQTYGSLLAGLAASFAVIHDGAEAPDGGTFRLYDDAGGLDEKAVVRLVSRCIGSAIRNDPPRFGQSIERAQRRLTITEDSFAPSTDRRFAAAASGGEGGADASEAGPCRGAGG